MASPHGPDDARHGGRVRLLIVPGLHGSEPAHWQSWLERSDPGAVRIAVDDWGQPTLARWSAAIDEALQAHRAAAWVAVGHSFGCLALAHHAARGGRGLQGMLLVAPADPRRFGIDETQVTQPLPCPSTLVVSRNDPWLPHADALYFGRRWGSEVVDVGEAGHINPAAGYGPWPDARAWVAEHVARVAALQRPRARAAGAPVPLGFAV